MKSGVLVGGQSVNLWAEICRARIPLELEPLAPFVSKDCDLHFRTRGHGQIRLHQMIVGAADFVAAAKARGIAVDGPLPAPPVRR